MTWQKRVAILFLIMAATVFLGELKTYPFGQQFRFSLGTACYFFGLIWFRSLRPLETGLFVGVFLLLFRSFLSMSSHDGSFWDYTYWHLPSTAYYLLFALVLALTNLRRYLDRPLIVGLIGTGADLLANIGELLVRNLMGADYSLDVHTLLILLLFGSLRSFFVVGLFNMLTIRQVRALGEQRQQQIDRLLLINSSLYEEGFYLRKSMRNIEDITRNSYALYKDLKATEKKDGLTSDLPTRALQIAEEVHELKKDTQRILAGLAKLMKQEEIGENITLRELSQLVINANSAYAQMLGKQIEFVAHTDVNLLTNRVYELVSILNNLVANAVESIQTSGRIGVEVHLRQGVLEWHVWDDGPGVHTDDADYVFQPGYTTKYDESGNPSTGIGLSHCQDLATLLGGTLEFLPESERTRFLLRMPSAELQKSDSPAKTPMQRILT